MQKRHSQRSKSQTKQLPRWDLTDLYNGITDPKIMTDLKRQLRRAEQFRVSFRGKITERSAKPKFILKVTKLYESILQSAVKPEIYASLVFTADSATEKHGAFMQKMKGEFLKIYNTIQFFELELTKLKSATLKKLANDSKLKNYRHYILLSLKSKPHRLSESEEKLLNDRALTGVSAFKRLYDQELSVKEFTVTIRGKTKRMTESQTLDLLYSANRMERKSAAKAFTIGLKEESRLLTYIYNILAEDKIVYDRYKKYLTAEEEQHLMNETDQQTIDTLSEVVTEHYHMVHDFYRFKKRVLKLPELFDYDRYAPVAKSNIKIPFKRGENLVLTAFDKFSPVYADHARAFFTHNWIDAAPTIGKRSGAFCMYVTPDLHPYVFLNYESNIKSVLTLAHELGHGVHASLARQQTHLNFDGPLTLAETASVFGEMLVFDDLKNSLTDPHDKFSLYMQKIEEMFATVFRQTAMYKFEQDFHTARREKGELKTEEINAIWRTRQQEMFGTSVTLTSDYDLWWSYIIHFYHLPFYVYAYAFGELLTLALYAHYKKDGVGMARKYLDMLSAMGTKSPQELLQPFGVNLHSRKFWEGGFVIMKEMIQEAKRLHHKLRYKV